MRFGGVRKRFLMGVGLNWTLWDRERRRGGVGVSAGAEHQGVLCSGGKTMRCAAQDKGSDQGAVAG